MTWLSIPDGPRNERDTVLGLHPEVYKNHQAFLEVCAQCVDAEVLQLCKARMAQAFRCREELANHDSGFLQELQQFSNSESFSHLQKRVIEFVDQFVLDPALINEELIAELEGAFGTKGMIDFTNVLAAFEASLRLSTLFDLEPAL